MISAGPGITGLPRIGLLLLGARTIHAEAGHATFTTEQARDPPLRSFCRSLTDERLAVRTLSKREETII